VGLFLCQNSKLNHSFGVSSTLDKYCKSELVWYFSAYDGACAIPPMFCHWNSAFWNRKTQVSQLAHYSVQYSWCMIVRWSWGVAINLGWICDWLLGMNKIYLILNLFNPFIYMSAQVENQLWSWRSRRWDYHWQHCTYVSLI